MFWAGGALIGTGLATEKASAEGAKLSPAVAHYQDTPKGKAECDTCVSFLAPSGCKLLTGKVSPSGWCMLYAAKH
jgi:hypothetical protein